jgi:hypothetical protein
MIARKPPRGVKSNHPGGAPPPAPAAPPIPVDLAHLRAKLAILREGGVASYRGADGEVINLFPTATPLTDDAREAQREAVAEANAEAETRRWAGASGGMRQAGGPSPVTDPALRHRFPPR